MFVAAAGVALLGFLLSWLLQERPLRETAATSTGLDDSLAGATLPDSLAEIERALSRATTREQRQRFSERLAKRAGIDLSPGATWALVRIDEHHGFRAGARALAEDNGVPPERIATVLAELRGRDLVGATTSHPRSRRQGTASPAARWPRDAELLTEALADESADREPAVEALLRRLSRELAGDRP